MGAQLSSLSANVTTRATDLATLAKPHLLQAQEKIKEHKKEIALILAIIALYQKIIKPILRQREREKLVALCEKRGFKVGVIGAGVSGLCAAYRLQQAGIPFVVYEAGGRVGGTWNENTYPGCACDVPSHLYSFSFDLNPDWSKHYAPQPEILAYLERFVEKFGLKKFIKFNTEVKEITWVEEERKWRLRTASGEEMYNVMLNGLGGLHHPSWPEVPDRESFKGDTMHSAKWNHKVDFTGKAVGVVGNAASAVQIIPEIAKQVKQLTVYQRTPNWVVERKVFNYGPISKFLFRHVPFLLKLYRLRIYLWNEFVHDLIGLDYVRPWYAPVMNFYFNLQRRKQVKNPELAAKLTPNYRPGCKRILISNDFYPTLQQPHVELVTEGLARVDPEGIITSDNKLRKHDIIVWATGFKMMSWGNFHAYGRGGVDLLEHFHNAPKTLYGITTDKFPNFFMLLGPNTGLGHNSIIFMIECQVNYAMKFIKKMLREDLATVEVKNEAVEKFYDTITKGLQSSVWLTGGCTSYYKNKEGVFAIWPWNCEKYARETHTPHWNSFELRH